MKVEQRRRPMSEGGEACTGRGCERFVWDLEEGEMSGFSVENRSGQEPSWNGGRGVAVEEAGDALIDRGPARRKKIGHFPVLSGKLIRRIGTYLLDLAPCSRAWTLLSLNRRVTLQEESRPFTLAMSGQRSTNRQCPEYL